MRNNWKKLYEEHIAECDEVDSQRLEQVTQLTRKLKEQEDRIERQETQLNHLYEDKNDWIIQNKNLVKEMDELVIASKGDLDRINTLSKRINELTGELSNARKVNLDSARNLTAYEVKMRNHHQAFSIIKILLEGNA